MCECNVAQTRQEPFMGLLHRKWRKWSGQLKEKIMNFLKYFYFSRNLQIEMGLPDNTFPVQPKKSNQFRKRFKETWINTIS